MHFPLLKNCGITMFMIKKLSKAYIKRFLRMTKALRFSCVMKKAIIADSAMAAFSRHSDEKYRGMGYGRLMVDHVKELAKERGCKAIILDSGMQRKAAHAFYEKYGFEKSCYGFELVL